MEVFTPKSSQYHSKICVSTTTIENIFYFPISFEYRQSYRRAVPEVLVQDEVLHRLSAERPESDNALR